MTKNSLATISAFGPFGVINSFGIEDTMRVILYLLAIRGGYTLANSGELARLLKASPSFYQTADETKLTAVTAAWANAMAITPASINYSTFSCLRCLKTDQLESALAYLLCNLTVPA